MGPSSRCNGKGVRDDDATTSKGVRDDDASTQESQPQQLCLANRDVGIACNEEQRPCMREGAHWCCVQKRAKVLH